MKIEPLLTAKNALAKGELRTILVSTFLISLILSFSQILVDPVINSDGIFYLYLASLIQQGDWQGATEIYNWLFYPYIISLFSTLTTLSLEYSAYVLNALLTATACVAFILIVKEFGGKQKVLLYSASLIILCYPNLNEYRNLVIRDHGYWAFYLLSCYCFIKAYKKLTPKALISLTFFTFLAALFRVEGVIFLIALPLLLLLRHISSIQKRTIAVVSILIAASLTIFVYSNAYENLNLNGFTKANQLEQALATAITNTSSAISTTKTFINTLSPQGFSNEYALAVLALLFILILLTEIVSSASPLYAIALVTAFSINKIFINRHLIRPWAYLIAINIIILCGFLATKYFLAGRYPVPLALILIIPLPFLAQLAYQRLQDKTLSPMQTNVAKIAAVLFVVLTLDGLVSIGASKTYLKDAGLWVAANKSPQVLLFTNDTLVNYYAHGQTKNRISEPSFNTVLYKIKKGALEKFDLFAIQVSRKKPSGKTNLIEAFEAKPIKVFENNRGDSVLIFKRPLPLS